MAASEPDDLQLRDKLLSRLMAESLATPATSDGVCPDAETIAAYVDQGLPTFVVEQLDAHFASCARCQQVLVALALSSDELPARLEALQPQPQPQAQEPSATLPFQTQTAPRGFVQTHWRWLAPAAAIAAAVALWFALRPAPPVQTLSAANETPAAQTPIAQAPIGQPSITENNSQTQPTEIPGTPAPVAPPAVAASSADSVSRESKDLSTDALKKVQSADESAELDAPAASPNPPPAKTEPQQTLQAEQRATGASGSLGANSSPAATATATAAAPPPRAAFAIPSAPPPSANASAGTNQAKVGGVGAAVAPLAARAAPLAMAPARTAIFSAPGGTALWRVGAGGSIERSSDQGRTWQRQVSGVTSDLTAGVATSATAAWVVGRAGVILHTTDGMNWQRVPFSSANNTAIPDFTGIDARDAQHATVTTADGHHFVTQNGGQTWTAQ